MTIFYIFFHPSLHLLLSSSWCLSSSSLSLSLGFWGLNSGFVLFSVKSLSEEKKIILMMEGSTVGIEDDDQLPILPPGFRFHPTDEEIIIYYLMEKFFNAAFTAIAIGEADLNKCEPWDLPKKAGMGEKERYFFCQRDRKYPTGMRTNRATTSGYWKATGKDKEIFQGKDCLVGLKKTLVFYKGRAPKGEKMNWIMHEYRIAGGKLSSIFPNSAKDEWVVCRIFHKNTGTKDYGQIQGSRSVNSSEDGHMAAPDYSSLPHLMDPAICTTWQSVGSGLPCEYPSINPSQVPRSMSDPFIGSNLHYYSFGFGLPDKQLPPPFMVSPSEETGHLADDLWEYYD